MLFSLSGYTFDDGTLYQDVKQIKPGTLLKYFNNKVSYHKLYTYNNKNLYQDTNLESKLRNVNEKLILKLIDHAKENM